MCTVTLIRTLPGSSEHWRLACNRDEQRTRSRGLPPRVLAVDGHRAVMPIDPESDGTWVGVNDAGLVAALLNANAPRAVHGRAPLGGSEASSMGLKVSRGTIVPKLMACADAASAATAMRSLNPKMYPPFRLIACDGRELLLAWGDGESLQLSAGAMGAAPVMFTSSGLGDALVERPRRLLFRQMFDPLRPGTWRDQQDAFHRHRMPGQPHLSVNMSRADARTVSLTVVERAGDTVTLTYHGDAPDAPTAGRDETVTLPLAAPAGADR